MRQAASSFPNTVPLASPPSAPLLAQKLQVEALASAPRARPFPVAQHAGPPSVPLSRRSPPTSRPASAPPVHLVQQAAAAAAARAGQAHWQRWGLQGGTDFEGFLRRQDRHAARAEAKLERQRQAAAVAPPAAVLSPGSARILERRQLAAAEAAAGVAEGRQDACPTEGDARVGSLAWVLGMAGTGAAPLPSPSKPAAARRLAPACLPRPASGASCSTAGSAATAATAPPAFTHHPAITARAAAKPGRSPEELHADWGARQARLVSG